MRSLVKQVRPARSRKVLLPCDDVYGDAKVLSGSPPTTQLAGCHYLPFKPDHAWGIFDKSGVLVRETADFRGPLERLHNQLDRFDPSSTSRPETSPEDIYIYGGSIHYHFGHFIVNTLSRFWAMRRTGHRRIKILMHGPGKIEDWFRLDFVREAFGALEISADDLVSFDRPVRLPQLIVPWPAFQEQKFIYTVFADFCHRVGERLIGDEPPLMNSRPVYLAKTGMSAAITRMVNESEIVNVVQAAGFEVLYPEQLTLSEKIRMFMEREWITGLSSSALHVSLFAQPQAKVRVLNPFSGPNGNFLLFDLVNNMDSEYFYSPGTRIEPSTTPGFDTDMWLAEPAGMAADLVDMIDWSPSARLPAWRWRPRWMDSRRSQR